MNARLEQHAALMRLAARTRRLNACISAVARAQTRRDVIAAQDRLAAYWDQVRRDKLIARGKSVSTGGGK